MTVDEAAFIACGPNESLQLTSAAQRPSRTHRSNPALATELWRQAPYKRTEDRMWRTLRRTEWLAGVLWALSWFELYLEVYRYRHVAPPRALGVPAPPLAVGAARRPAGGCARYWRARARPVSRRRTRGVAPGAAPAGGRRGAGAAVPARAGGG